MLPPNNWNKARLLTLVKDGVPESLTVEYKQSAAIDNSDTKKDAMCKFVSAFANSAGGILVYGIEENNQLPTQLDAGIDGEQYTKEWFENIINSKIHRRIQGISIHHIKISSRSNNVYVVIEVPQSNLAPHQAPDKKFYKRYNFQVLPMEEYEIRDMGLRREGPDLTLNLRPQTHIVNEPGVNRHQIIQFFPIIGNDSIIPAEFSHIDIAFDYRLNLSNVSDFEMQDSVWVKFGETLQLPVTYYSRAWSSPANIPIYQSVSYRLSTDSFRAKIEPPLKEREEYFIYASLKAPYIKEKQMFFIVRADRESVSIDEQSYSLEEFLQMHNGPWLNTKDFPV